MTCLCGQEITAEDVDALIPIVIDHAREVHNGLELTPVNVRNFLAAEERTAGAPTERLESIGDLEIVPIAPERAEDVARFFDHDAFPDNYAWASCYCTSYFEDDEANRPWQDNRAATCARIDRGILTGTLAYVDGKLAGFCNASGRTYLERRSDGDDSGICSVVCFVIAPPYRQHGIAGRLLDAAIEQARFNGFTVMEAYPRRNPDNATHAYYGSPGMYQRAGFAVTSEDPLVVRLDL